MTEADSQSQTRGYGNIYTPHAGSMVIQVQREGGLANRTFVLSERQVKLLRFGASRIGAVTVAVVVASWLFFAIEAARVPLLTHRLSTLERDSRRIDTLKATLGLLQQRYDQLQKMFGAPVSAPGPRSVVTGPRPSTSPLLDTSSPLKTASADSAFAAAPTHALPVPSPIRRSRRPLRRVSPIPAPLPVSDTLIVPSPVPPTAP